MRALPGCAGLAAVACAALVAAGSAQARPSDPDKPQAISRAYGGANTHLAATVRVPAGAETLYVSGCIAAVADPAAPKGSAALYGGATEAQTARVLDKIEGLLKAQGYGLADVISLRVYLAPDPANGGRLDFAAMGRAYDRRFGTPAQPNRPARNTVGVAALPIPGTLVQIEAIAAKVAR